MGIVTYGRVSDSTTILHLKATASGALIKGPRVTLRKFLRSVQLSA